MEDVLEVPAECKRKGATSQKVAQIFLVRGLGRNSVKPTKPVALGFRTGFGSSSRLCDLIRYLAQGQAANETVGDDALNVTISHVCIGSMHHACSTHPLPINQL